MDPSVYVWRSGPVGGEHTPDVVSDASCGMLAVLGLQGGARKRVLIEPNVTIAVGRESGIDADCAHVEGIVRWLLDNDSLRERAAIGIWVKCLREGGKRPRRLEEHHPGICHRPVLPRRQRQMGAWARAGAAAGARPADGRLHSAEPGVPLHPLQKQHSSPIEELG